MFAMKRNYGIDLLRMVLMLMVVAIHVLTHGGVIKATEQLSANYSMSILMESFVFCAVNCYALISGYVYIDSRYRFSGLVQIWLQALLYSLGIAVFVWILKPEYFSFEGLLIHSFPVSNAPYWYLSAYVGLFVLIPFLNAGIHSLSNEQAKKYQALLFFVFSIIPTIARKDTFFVNVGYSTIWLSYLYGIGACIKKFGWGDSLKPCKAIWIYVCCVVISWGMKVGCESVTNYLLGTPKTGFILIAYTSPTIIIAAIALLIAFKNMRIPTRFNGFISAFTPAAFGVYLIHEHEYFRNQFILNKFAFLAKLSTPVMIIGVLSAALVIFAVCLLIDWIRYKIFVRLRVKERLERIEEKYIRFNIAIK